MKSKCIFKRLVSFLLVTILGIVPPMTAIGTLPVQAAAYEKNGVVYDGSASWANDESKVTGTWSYWVKDQEIVNQNSGLLSKLPDKGTPYRQTTANYDKNNGAFDSSDWATSFMWDVDLDNPYSSSVYAIPLAFRASVDGGAKNVIQVTAPSSLSDTANNTYTMQMPSNGTVTDFFIQTSFNNVTSAKVDAVTDWSYDVVLENASNTSQYMKTTMVQGSIFAYFQLKNDDRLTILRGKSLPAAIAYTSDGGNIIVVRCMDNMDGDYDYYAFYASEGTKFNVTTSGNMISSIDVQFPSADKAYMSLAYLGSTPNSPSDSWGAGMCQAYLPYAYNFVTDTKATYSYNEETSTVSTVYTYTLDRKAESTADGTIMGVLPHQYKNIKVGTNFLDYTYETVRGTMKTIAGKSFATELRYSGIIPFMPDYSDNQKEEDTLSAYLNEYVEQFGGNYFKNYEGSGDTYWDGKGLNRLANAMAAAEVAGDTELAADMLTQLKNRLHEWFTYTDDGKDTTYFYYDDGVGSMFGFPQSYDSVNQINDHHFHYGYFIYAAAQVAFRDKTGEWAKAYGGIIEELINDIACRERNSASSKYPYLRNFAPYEGHSWASGHANFDMGNNQESSSEALNAWAGIILWGEATGNKEIRDLGIYLYTTEISAVQNYWYDVDEDVLSDAYRYKVGVNQVDTIDKSTAKVQNNSAAIVWGGSYTYATWFSANPLYIQGINLLPMNPTCFYLAGDADYIQQNWDLAYEKASASGWDLESWVDIWCQYYAMAFPEEALSKWKTANSGDSYGVEGGDTKAHTYHFIQSMCTYGTPDTSISSDATLSTVFVKDGVKTYVAYNATNAEKTVTFSDGYQIKVAANSMGVEKEGSNSNQAKYTIEYYVENTDGNFVLNETESQYGIVGETVTAEELEIAGYVFDSDNNSNVKSATVNKSGTVLKLYYERESYKIAYELNGGKNAAGNPTSYKYKDSILLLEATKQGYDFTGWYKDVGLTTEVTMISDTDMGDITLYAGWQDPNEFDLDATKKLTYDDGVITVTVSGVEQKSGNSVDILWRICNEADVKNIVAGGAGALTGRATTYENGVWTAKFDASNGVETGKYFVFMTNVIRDGVGDLSGVGVYLIPDASASNKVTYYENYYHQNLDGSFSLFESVKKKAEAGVSVTLAEKNFTGFVFDSTNTANKLSDTVASDGSTTLARYYKRATYTITYHLNGGNAAGNPNGYTYGQVVTLNDPTQSGKTFRGWYTNEACTTAFTGITATTTGNITLYAKWINEGSEQAKYKVEHYRQKAEGSINYTLYETDSLKGYVDEIAYASAKSYEGYTENTNHSKRVASGVILEDGSLVLKLYYDLVVEGGSTEGFGVTYNANTGMATFYYNGATGGTVYIAVVDSESTAQGYVANANAVWPGFDSVPGHAGYPMTADSTGAKYELAVAEGKYLVYAFNPSNKGVEKWYVAKASAIAPENAATYTVNHYKQDSEGAATYTLADTETLTGEIGTTVTASAKNYVGYKLNESHTNYKASGTVAENGSLILSLYYDKSTDGGYVSPDGGGFTYSASNGIATFYYEGASNGIVYIAAYDTEAQAAEIMAKANAAWPGFEHVTGHAGYNLNASGDKATADFYVAEGKYLVYAFNPNYAGVQDWYIGVASESQSGGGGGEVTTTANYTVKHYKQNATGSANYTLTESETLTGIVGNTVIATTKKYEGYILNKEHGRYKASGIVAEDGSLVLELYYDIVDSESTGGGLEMPTGGGYVYDSETDLLTIYMEGVTSGMGYYGAYADRAGAQAAVDNANDNLPGFGYVNHAGYQMDSVNGRAEFTIPYAVAEGTYFAYTFAGIGANPEKWYVGVASNEPIGGGEEPDPDVKIATYAVEHYKEISLGLGEYTLAEREVLEAQVDKNVTATVKDYNGYKVNKSHADYVESGTVAEDGSLVLKLYYNVVDNSIGGDGGRGAAIKDGTIVAWVDNPPEGVTQIKFIAAVFADRTSAEERMKNPSDAGMPGYMLEADGDGTYSKIANEIPQVSDTDYLLYQFYIAPPGEFTGWILTTKAELEDAGNGGSETPEPSTEASYTVKYYQQNTDLNTYMEVTDDEINSEPVTIGNEVEAPEKTYEGFALNTDKSITTGKVLADGSLVLSVYYDRIKYGIKYNNMDGATNAAENTDTYAHGVGLTLGAPVKTGYSFDGWYTDEEFTEVNKITVIGADSTGEVVLYAKWTENEVIEDLVAYTIKYYQQNTDLTTYTEIEEDQVNGSRTAGETVNAIIKSYTGFVLNGSSVTSGELVSGTPLVLELRYDRESYAITYHNVEGVTNTNLTTYTYGIGVVLADVSKEDYTFDGWYKNEACTATSKVTEISTSQIGEVTLYAKWIENEVEEERASYVIKHFKQNADLNGYTEVEADRVTDSSVVGSLVNAIANEYRGFTHNPNAEGTLDKAEVLADGSLVLSVYYDRNVYSIRYQNMEDAINAETNVDTYVYGVGLELADATKEGYIFDGWYTDAIFSDSAKITVIGTEQTRDVVVYAKWTSPATDPVWMVEAVKDHYYTGKKITPAVVVTYEGKKLQKNKDYSISYRDNTNAGVATIIIKGKGNYNETKEIKFNILPIDLGTEPTVTTTDIYKFVTGNDIKMSPTVKWGSKKLKLGKDFEIDETIPDSRLVYKKVGKYEMVLNGIGNYTGTTSLDVVLTDKKTTTLISKAKVSKVYDENFVEGKNEYCPEVTLTYKNTTLVEDTHYEVDYVNNENVGKAQIVIRGLTNDPEMMFTGTKTINFKIKGEKLSSSRVTLDKKEYFYTGDRIEPIVTVKNKNKEEISKEDYTVKYSNNVEKGKGKITITAKNGYEGTVTKTFNIKALSVDAAVVRKEAETPVSYMKGGAKAGVVVTYNDEVLTENVDYTLKYSGNKDLREASVTISGKGNYGGKTTLTFQIEEADLGNVLMTASDVVYNSKKKMSYYMSKPTLTDLDGKKLSAGKDYEKVLTYEVWDKETGSWKVITASDDASQIKPDTKLRVTAKGMNNYKVGSTNMVEYHVIESNKTIKSAKVTIKQQTYTGRPITITKEDIQSVTIKNVPLDSENYEIVPGSYKNNIKKGTASVTIKGVGEWGGYRTATFKIVAKNISEDTSYISRMLNWFKNLGRKDEGYGTVK